MKITRNRTIALIGGAAAVIGLGVVAGPVLADSVIGGDHRDADHEQFAKDLAAKLGVPQSKVDDALESMQGDRLGQRIDQLEASGALTADQASSIKAKIAANDVDGALKELRGDLAATQLAALVQKGTVTQDQADQVAALITAGAPVGLRVAPDGSQPPKHAESADHQRHQVQELQQRGALTADQAKEITALVDAGKTDEAETRIHGAMDAGMLKQLVQRKVVTQAQADQISGLIAAGVPIGIGGPGMDGPGGHRGHHGPDMDGDHHGMDMDGDHHGMDMDGDHAPGMGGQQGGSSGGGFQQQSYGSDAGGA